MNFKKSLKDVVVLVVICSVFATVLAAVNSVTAPIIADRLNAAADEAYLAVMPGANGFEDVDLSAYDLPATVKEAKRETGGQGYAIKLETKGYATGLIIIVGVSADGVVTGSTCIASNETWGLEGGLGEKVVGKDINTIVDVEAGATSLTVNGYRSAVKDAINAATILGGGSADLRTEEEILADNLNAALSTSESSFTKMFMVEVVDGVDKIYIEDNGLGYVCVIGEQFVGIGADGVVNVVDAEGNVVTEGIDEVKATAEAAVAIVTATELSDEIDITEYKNSTEKPIKNAFKNITSIKKTATGNYVFEVKADGHGINGDKYYHPSGEQIEMMVSISADGKIIDVQTVKHSETDNWGGVQLVDGAFNSNFFGKTQEEANDVNIVAGTTNTTKGYKQAIMNCFTAYTTIEGGATNE